MATPPLALAVCALVRADPRLASFPHVTALLSQFLDRSVHLTPAAAAASGSLDLFDRVYQRVTYDATLHRALLDHWLARALQVALERDDLPMVQRIHACHPAPLFVHAAIASPAVSSSTLALALQYGSLETVQWVIAHRADRLCCPPGVKNLCRGCLLAALPCLGDTDPFRIFCWLMESGIFPRLTERNVGRLWPFMVRSVDVVKWLYKRRLLSRHTGEMVLTRAVEDGRTAIVTYLLTKGCRIRGEKTIQRKLISAACFDYSEVVGALLGSGQYQSIQHQFQWGDGNFLLLGWLGSTMNDSTRGSEAVRDALRTEASRAGNVRILDWLYRTHHTTPSMWHLQNHLKTEEALLAVYKWMHHVGIHDHWAGSLDAACRDGMLDVVQWLHANAREACAYTTKAMDHAAANGHMDVVKWLHVNRVEGCSEASITHAAGNGHLNVVQWLLVHYPELRTCVQDAKIHAAAGGQLDVLVWLCRLDGASCRRCLMRAALHGKPSEPTCPAWPDVLRWIPSLTDAQCSDCDISYHVDLSNPHAIISAAYSGDLNLVKYLIESHDQNQADPLTQTMTAIAGHVAEQGHRAIVEYLFATFPSRRGDSKQGSSCSTTNASDALHHANACSVEQIAAWMDT